MNPTIHDYTASDLDSQGYGALSDCISAEVSEELNGAYTMELKYPLDGQLSEYLIPGAVIMAKPNHVQIKQPFRVNEVKKSFNNSIMVYANHISYDLSGYSLRAARSYNSLADTIIAMNQMDWSSDNPVYHQFTFSTDITSAKTFKMPAIQTLRSWMGGQDGSLIDVYGGEWEYNGFDCSLRSRRGSDTGIRISYGKNLAEYEKDRKYTQYSHVCAWWKKQEAVAFGNLVPTHTRCTFRTAYVDASKEFNETPTISQLDSIANDYIKSTSENTQTITITPAQVGNDTIGLGDSVLICYDNVIQTRVIKTVWDVLTEEYKTLQLGSKQANIADTIKSLATGPSGESGTVTPADYIVEAVNNQNDGYTKWASGKLECWKRQTITVNATSAWTSPIYYGSYAGVTYNATFIYYPVVNITIQSTNGYVWLAPSYSDYSLTSTGTLYFYSVGSHSNVEVTLNIHCVGKWK